MTNTKKQEGDARHQWGDYLQVLTRLGIEATEVQGPNRTEGRETVDGWLRLVGTWGTQDWVVEEKPRIDRAALGPVIDRMKRLRNTCAHAILVTHHVTPQIAEDLRLHDIPFVDAAGNAFLKDKGLYVWVTNRRPPKVAAHARHGLHAAGLKLLRLILRGNTIQATHRALAEHAGIALGGVGRLLREFEYRGWIRRTGTDRLEVQDGEAMLRAWDEGYAVTLRQKLVLRTCRRRPGAELEQLARIAATGEWAGRVLVGGELGAAMLTQHLRPTTAALHVHAADAPEVMRQFGLLPDPEGDVLLLRRFGNTDADLRPVEVDGATIADPLLVRAELLVRPDDRIRETAEIIRTNLITIRGA